MSSATNHLIPRRVRTRSPLSAFLFLLLCSTPAFTQETPPKSSAPTKYDLQTETKAKGVVDEVKVFDFGTHKDFVQLIVKDGTESVVVYVCPKPFQEEMGNHLHQGRTDFTCWIEGEAGGVRSDSRS